MTTEEKKLISLLCTSTSDQAITLSNVSRALTLSDVPTDEDPDYITDAADILQANLKPACKELVSIIKDAKTRPQVKVNAINVLFNACESLTELSDVLDRVERLEKFVEDGEPFNE